MTRGRSVAASVSLALLLGVAPVAHAGSPGRAAAPADGQTPPVPAGFTLSDFASDAGFESGASGFTPGSALDGAVARDSSDPIDGSASLHTSR